MKTSQRYRDRLSRTLVLSLGLLSSLVCFAEHHLKTAGHPYVYHLIQSSLWEPADEANVTYFPPTYEVDGFTHGTTNPDKLLNVANHFYPDV